MRSGSHEIWASRSQSKMEDVGCDVRCTKGSTRGPGELLGTALRLEEIPRIPQRIEDKLSQDLTSQVGGQLGG